MNRRFLLTGLASAAAIPAIGLPAIASESEYVTYFNREGIPLKFDLEYLEFHVRNYELEVAQVVEEMFGTIYYYEQIQFTAERRSYKICTNDARDFLMYQNYYTDQKPINRWVRNYSGPNGYERFRNVTNQANYDKSVAEFTQKWKSSLEPLDREKSKI